MLKITVNTTRTDGQSNLDYVAATFNGANLSDLDNENGPQSLLLIFDRALAATLDERTANTQPFYTVFNAIAEEEGTAMLCMNNTNTYDAITITGENLKTTMQNIQKTAKTQKTQGMALPTELPPGFGDAFN